MMYTNQPAGFLIRALASVLDFFILVTPISVLFFMITGQFSDEWMQGFVWQVIYVGYLTILPVVWSGYVIGKRICGIKILRVDQGEVTLMNMVLREVVGNFIIALLTFGISAVVSIFMIMFRSDKRGIHDLIAGTYVKHT